MAASLPIGTDESSHPAFAHQASTPVVSAWPWLFVCRYQGRLYIAAGVNLTSSAGEIGYYSPILWSLDNTMKTTPTNALHIAHRSLYWRLLLLEL